jgi:hypothetical protein
MNGTRKNMRVDRSRVISTGMHVMTYTYTIHRFLTGGGGG